MPKSVIWRSLSFTFLLYLYLKMDSRRRKWNIVREKKMVGNVLDWKAIYAVVYADKYASHTTVYVKFHYKCNTLSNSNKMTRGRKCREEGRRGGRDGTVECVAMRRLWVNWPGRGHVRFIGIIIHCRLSPPTLRPALR